MVAGLILLCTLLGLSNAASFRLNDSSTGVLCLLLDGTLTVFTNETGDVLNTAHLSSASSCNLTTKYALLAFTWNASYEMNFTFEGNSSMWGLKNISYMYMDSGETATALASTLFTATSNRVSYECDTSQNVSFSPSSVIVILGVSNWKAQAFNFTNGSFDGAKHCLLDPTPTPSPTATPSPSPTTPSPSPTTTDNKVVPIAVGAALAGLVIIVLIVYLIGRFKSRRETSYQVLP